MLDDMLRTGRAIDANGCEVTIEAAISSRLADALFGVVSEKRPAVALEVGMAFGVSTLAMLTALDTVGGDGCLHSVDPHQFARWRGCGAQSVALAGLSDRHRVHALASHVALPRLLDGGTVIDFAYIDGWHTFDYALLDFLFIDKMLSVGGIVAFNDCGFDAVDKVIRFVVTHRDYVEIDVGLPLVFAGTTWWRELRRMLRRRSKAESYPRHGDRYFVKRSGREPEWNFFAEF